MNKYGFTLLEACAVVIIVSILIAIPVMYWRSCEQQARIMNMRYDWGPAQGCMIETSPGRWAPIQNYRVF